MPVGKFRIVTTESGRFKIQYRSFFWFSYDDVHYGLSTIEDAEKKCRQLIDSKKFKPKVVKKY